MKRYFLLMLMLTTISVSIYSQKRQISGLLTDKDTKEAIVQATVQLLKGDSTFVSGAISDFQGGFSIIAPANGRYLLKITSIAYKPLMKVINISQDKDLSLGTLTMTTDAIQLKGATVVGQAAKVVLKEDTFVYNSSAYRVPEGSVAEELVRRLPGAQISDDGKITLNGKEVKKVLVDGKEFMTGDTKTAIKNLPTSIIDKVKAYDEKSDLTKVTGIDDGNEQTVIDFGIKKGMNKGLLSNTDIGVGNKDRYSARSMGGYFTDKIRTMMFGSANNVGDRGFGGGRGGFMSNNGLNASKMLGGNVNYEKKNVITIDGSLRWNHNDGDVRSSSSSENFVSTVGSFSNSLNQNYTRSNSWNGQMRLEWTPDTMTDIMFRPNISYTTNDGRNMSNSAAYKDDPYKYVTDPLTAESIAALAADSMMVNTRNNSSISYSDSKTFGAMLQVNRKLNNKGRNVTARADVSYNSGNSKSLSTQNVHLYQVTNALGTDSTYQTNRYSVTPTKTWSYSVQATYSEPIAKATFLQFMYTFKYKYSKSDRSTYDFSNLGEEFFGSLNPQYRDWNSYLGLLSNPLDSYLDNNLSRYSEYKDYINEFQLMLRKVGTKYNFNIGFMVQPQKSHYTQNYQGVHVDTTRTVTNISPTLDFRYRFSKVSNLRINYRGETEQPSMSDLLDITDDSDPLNISKGNPGLKPSFTNNFRLFYNNYTQSHQRSVMANINYSNTRNSISNMVTYDDKTGGRITQPQNINGNWNTSGMFMFNTSVDSAGCWNINTFTNLSYNHYVGYLNLNQNSNSEKNTTRTMTIGERLSLSYRNSWLEIEPNGSLNYTHTRNLLQTQSNLDTWNFNYGVDVNLTAPWGTSLSTDVHENSRRGYNDNAMNTNELVWNAQVSQSFLKGKPLTVSLQFYDILHNQSNFSRTITAMQRSDTQYNNINSYAMLHVIYRMNMFGGQQARRAFRDRHNGDGPGEDGPGPRGDRPPGGFGHRPPGGGGFGGPMGGD